LIICPSILLFENEMSHGLRRWITRFYPKFPFLGWKLVNFCQNLHMFTRILTEKALTEFEWSTGNFPLQISLKLQCKIEFTHETNHGRDRISACIRQLEESDQEMKLNFVARSMPILLKEAEIPKYSQKESSKRVSIHYRSGLYKSPPANSWVEWLLLSKKGRINHESTSKSWTCSASF
jgi:hypothetical protein